MSEVICGARLEVTIRSTTYAMKCHEPPHVETDPHRTPQGSEWTVPVDSGMFCPNRACCAERGHDGPCDERAAL